MADFNRIQELLLDDVGLFTWFSTPELLFFHSVSMFWQKVARCMLIARPLRLGIDIKMEGNITRTRGLLGERTIRKFKRLQSILAADVWAHPFLSLPPGDLELPETGEYGRDRRLEIAVSNITIVGAPPRNSQDLFPTKIHGQFFVSSTDVVLIGMSIQDRDTGGVGVFIVGQKHRHQQLSNRVIVRNCEIKSCENCAIRMSYAVHCVIDECYIHHNRNGVELFATMDARFQWQQGQRDVVVRTCCCNIINSDVSHNSINGITANAHTLVHVYDNKELHVKEQAHAQAHAQAQDFGPLGCFVVRPIPDMSVHHNGCMGLRAVLRHARIVVHVPSTHTQVSHDNAVLNQFAIPTNTAVEASGVIVKAVYTLQGQSKSGGSGKRKSISVKEHDEQELLLKKRFRDGDGEYMYM